VNEFNVVRLQGLGFPRAIQQILQNHPDFSDLSFSSQQEILVRERSVYSSGFSEGMKRLGNSATEIFFDFELAQKKWADEQGLPFLQDSWRDEIALAQLKTLQPDVLYLQDIYGLSENSRRKIKELVPSIKLVVIQKGYPGETRDLSDADILLVSSPILYDRYKERGQNPHLIYHSFDETLSKDGASMSQGERESFVFAGSSRAPEDRYWMLRNLLKQTSIKLWADEDRSSHEKHGGKLNLLGWKRYLRQSLIELVKKDNANLLRGALSLAASISKVERVLAQADFSKDHGPTVRSLPGLSRGLLPKETLSEEFPDRCYRSLFGKDYYDLLNRSDIVFNIHSTKSGNTVDNMKMFESTGMGACLLTDTGRNMKDLFEEDFEVVTYASAPEAISKAKYLLENPEEAKKISAAGRAKTLAQHTMAHRCEEINGIIRAQL
jgi:spore maturation protein CgeB